MLLMVFFSDPPEVMEEQPIVFTTEGEETEIVCIVHAEPKAEVSIFYFFFRKFLIVFIRIIVQQTFGLCITYKLYVGIPPTVRTNVRFYHTYCVNNTNKI